tara:strand:- start:112 stop:1143 length:1032 start_codon:yes stop_codon:yes gene_type:complete
MTNKISGDLSQYSIHSSLFTGIINFNYLIYDPVSLSIHRSHTNCGQVLKKIDQELNFRLRKKIKEYSEGHCDASNSIICIEQMYFNYWMFLSIYIPHLREMLEINKSYSLDFESLVVGNNLTQQSFDCLCMILDYYGDYKLFSANNVLLSLENVLVDKTYFRNKNTPTNLKALRAVESCNFLKHLFATPRSSISFKKIFIDRSSESGNKSFMRRLYPFNEFYDDLLSHGYKIIYLESMSFLEQAEIFANVEIIMTYHGAALSNIGYCRKNAKVIEICHKNNNYEMYREMASILGLAFRRVECESLLELDIEKQFLRTLGYSNYYTNPLPLLYDQRVKKELFEG